MLALLIIDTVGLAIVLIGMIAMSAENQRIIEKLKDIVSLQSQIKGLITAGDNALGEVRRLVTETTLARPHIVQRKTDDR
jgi:hypothetical protein